MEAVCARFLIRSGFTALDMYIDIMASSGCVRSYHPIPSFYLHKTAKELLLVTELSFRFSNSNIFLGRIGPQVPLKIDRAIPLPE